MALENLLDASLSYDDGLVSDPGMSVASRKVTSAGKRKTHLIQNVGFAAAEAVQLGELTAPGALMLKNLDPTNFINVLVATAGSIFAKLRPDTGGDGKGGFILIDCMGSGAQAPFVQSDTASCRMEVMTVEV
jgi:hypothetical protein